MQDRYDSRHARCSWFNSTALREGRYFIKTFEYNGIYFWHCC